MFLFKGTPKRKKNDFFGIGKNHFNTKYTILATRTRVASQKKKKTKKTGCDATLTFPYHLTMTSWILTAFTRAQLIL